MIILAEIGSSSLPWPNMIFFGHAAQSDEVSPNYFTLQRDIGHFLSITLPVVTIGQIQIIFQTLEFISRVMISYKQASFYIREFRQHHE